MGCSEPDGWKAGVHVGEMVVVVRDVELPFVLAGVVVRVPDQAALFGCEFPCLKGVMNTTCLPVIVELVP